MEKRKKLQAGTFELSTSSRVWKIYKERAETHNKRFILLRIGSKQACITKAFEGQPPCFIIENLPRTENELTRLQMIILTTFLPHWNVFSELGTSFYLLCYWHVGTSSYKENNHPFTLLLAFVVFITRINHYKTYISKNVIMCCYIRVNRRQYCLLLTINFTQTRQFKYWPNLGFTVMNNQMGGYQLFA